MGPALGQAEVAAVVAAARATLDPA
jgi:hypothetical protein